MKRSIFIILIATLSMAMPTYADDFGISEGDIGVNLDGSLLNEVGFYAMQVDQLQSALQGVPGRFKQTNRALGKIKKHLPKLLEKLQSHRHKSHIQGPLSLVNIFHKQTLQHLYREGKGKDLMLIAPELMAMEQQMTLIRLKIVEKFALHIVL